MAGLNPSDKAVKELERPVNKAGTHCPLWRKPVSKVCHTCEFWQPVRLQVNGQEEITWKCAFVWQPTLQLLTQHSNEMVERETAELRHSFVNFRAAVGQLIGQMAQASHIIEENKPPKLIEAAKVIEDGTKSETSG